MQFWLLYSIYGLLLVYKTLRFPLLSYENVKFSTIIPPRESKNRFIFKDFMLLTRLSPATTIEPAFRSNRYSMNRLFSGLLAVLMCAVFGAGQVKQTENTFKLADGQRGDKASISDMEWLAGTWSGDGLGGFSEEIWSQPKGGIMMGMYRMTKADKPVFYELLTLSESEGTLLLRLKHFNSDFTGWEEKDKTVDFRYIRKDDRRIYFEGMTFEPLGKDVLNVYVAIGQRDGKTAEAVFKYKRVK